MLYRTINVLRAQSPRLLCTHALNRKALVAYRSIQRFIDPCESADHFCKSTVLTTAPCNKVMNPNENNETASLLSLRFLPDHRPLSSTCVAHFVVLVRLCCVSAAKIRCAGYVRMLVVARYSEHFATTLFVFRRRCNARCHSAWDNASGTLCTLKLSCFPVSPAVSLSSITTVHLLLVFFLSLF